LVSAGSGTIFDPRIVQISLENHATIERVVREACDLLPTPGFRSAISAARKEDRLLSQLNRDLGNSLSLPETLSACDFHLRELIGYDCIVLYEVRESGLSPVYVKGNNAHLFCSTDIPRAASALTVALESGGQAIAVLALYHEVVGAFDSEDLRILLAI